jgi:polyisoprenoid-binding protein YceI
VYVQAVESDPPPPLRIADLPQMQEHTTTTSRVDDPAGATTLPPVAGPEAAGAPSTSIAAVAATAPPTTAVTVDGAYRVGAGSEARYGIDDTIIGSRTRVVGRTQQVTGSMTIAGQTVTATKVVVDMRSVRCGCVHDQKYQDLLDTQQYPTSQFVLTTPIPIASIPADGVVVRIPVTGQLTIHGRTRTQSFPISAARRNGVIAVNGTIPVKLGDYGIEQPSAGPFGGIDNADIELLIAFVPGP